MSIGKLLLKIRHHVESPYNSAILIILIIFGIICSSSADIAPNDDSTANDNLNTIENLDLNSILVNDDNKINVNQEKPSDSEGIRNPSTIIPDLGFLHAFIASISVILVSELGDKTFFIAAIMAMRHPRLTVFTGAISALALMTILSAVFGMAATIIPRAYTYYISTALFAIFGLKMLRDGYYMSETDAQEELEEVQSDLRKREDELMRTTAKKNKDKNEDESPTSSDEDEQNHSVNSNNKTSNNNNLNDVNDVSVISLQLNLSPTSIAASNGERRTKSTSNLITNHNNDTIEKNSSVSIDEGIDVMEASTSTSRLGLGNHISKDDNIGAISLNDGITSTINSSKATAGGNMELIHAGGAKKRLERESATTAMITDPESGVTRKIPKRNTYYLATRIFMQAFTMTFLAEWGDRSQLTTIILGAREDVYGVIVGGVLGHSICTGLAVIGGRMIAQKISVRTVTLVGGVVFLVFAISALFFDPNDT